MGGTRAIPLCERGGSGPNVRTCVLSSTISNIADRVSFREDIEKENLEKEIDK